MSEKKTIERWLNVPQHGCRGIFKNSRKISICDQSVTFIMIRSFLSKEVISHNNILFLFFGGVTNQKLC